MSRSTRQQGKLDKVSKNLGAWPTFHLATVGFTVTSSCGPSALDHYLRTQSPPTLTQGTNLIAHEPQPPFMTPDAGT